MPIRPVTGIALLYLLLPIIIYTTIVLGDITNLYRVLFLNSTKVNVDLAASQIKTLKVKC
jgi:hypothetical protein